MLNKKIITWIGVLALAGMPTACNGTGDTDLETSIPEQPGTATSPSESVQISIPLGAGGLGPRAFGTNPREVPFGATVVWTNNDNVAHTVTSNDSTFNSGPIKPGGKFEFTFTRSGTYGYYCSIYGMGSMSGTIEVQ